MIAFVFPGQGVQHQRMGSGLFEKYPDEVRIADDVLGYSIEELCLQNPDNRLNHTRYTQPAIYVVNALMYFEKIKAFGRAPDYLAGHSSGEYNALLAAGAFSFETGLKLIVKRSELMDIDQNGGMTAIIGLKTDQFSKILKKHQIDDIEVANYNSPRQIVIAGSSERLDQIQTLFKHHGAKCVIPLNVSGAFHSSYMVSAKKQFEQFIDSVKFRDLKIPVVSNFTARPYQYRDIKHKLCNQITHCVKWTESIHYLLNKGVDEFVEIGTGNVLTKLIQDIRNEYEKTASSRPTPTPAKTKSINSDRASFREITPEALGNASFKKEYNLKYAYAAGGMGGGISSEELVIRLGKAHMIGFFGTRGLSTVRVEKAIRTIQNALKNGEAYGFNLTHDRYNTENNDQLIALLIKYNVQSIEISGFVDVDPSLVKYRVSGLKRMPDGTISVRNKILAKVTRPDVATKFLSPAPAPILQSLVSSGLITAEEADLATHVPMADDICGQADSAGYTDHASAYSLLPSLIDLRAKLSESYGYRKIVRIGSSGGIGTPQAAAAAFILGADFIITGSINQCTVEANVCDAAKNLLQSMNVQDTTYIPSDDLLAWGTKIQVLKKSTLFPARAQNLFNAFKDCNRIDQIDPKDLEFVEKKVFKKTISAVLEDINDAAVYPLSSHMAPNPCLELAKCIQWYYRRAAQMAQSGIEQNKPEFLLFCGPALGAFNQWVKGTEIDDWKNRRVDSIGQKLMEAAADFLRQRYRSITS